MRANRIAWGLVLCLAWAGPAAGAGDVYFAVVFGAQRPIIKDPRYSHSWATFAHLTPAGRLEAFSISWLPCTGQIHVLSLTPEPGRNYTLAETLRFCWDNRMEVARWGPYQIHPDLWNRALWQKNRLESGQVLYKAFDAGSPDGRVSNCIHAVSFIARQPGQTTPDVIVAPANWGESGSYWVALTLRPWYIEPCCRHDWVLTALGLDPAAYTAYGLDRNPTLNPVTRAVQAALQSYLLPNRVDCCR